MHTSVVSCATASGSVRPQLCDAIDSSRGRPLAERIPSGGICEVLSEEDPTYAWPVSVLGNVGGRLKLLYWPLPDTDQFQEDEFWVYCNSYLVRPLGSTMKYKIPGGWSSVSAIAEYNNSKRFNQTFRIGPYFIETAGSRI